MSKLPTYFISHGGGPWPWLKNEMPDYDLLEKSLREIPATLPQTPRAVLVISAHWEEDEFAVMGSPRPPMLYDYGGFPAHTYQIQYAASGAPVLAARVQELVEKNLHVKVRIDNVRGFDHGTFVPLFVMYPNAEIPAVQLSLRNDYDPQAHLDLGRALAPLRDEGVLILGSGLSYHNMRGFFGREPNAGSDSRAFDDWLQITLTKSTPAARVQNLLCWADAPSARAAHPQEDHLIPLMVAVGAAENEVATTVYHQSDFAGQISASSFRFG